MRRFVDQWFVLDKTCSLQSPNYANFNGSQSSPFLVELMMFDVPRVLLSFLSLLSILSISCLRFFPSDHFHCGNEKRRSDQITLCRSRCRSNRLSLVRMPTSQQ
jgi:hypothetical protein